MTSSQDPTSNWILNDEDDFFNVLQPHNMIGETQSQMSYGERYISGLEVSPFGNKYNVKSDTSFSELDKYLSNWRPSDQQENGSSNQQPVNEPHRIDRMTETETIDYLAELMLEEPSQPKQQPLQSIINGNNEIEIGSSNVTKNDNLKNDLVQNTIQYSELKQLPNTNNQNAQNSKNVNPNSNIGMIDYLAGLFTDEQSQTKTQPMHENDKIMTNNTFDGSNTAQKSNFEYNHLQNTLQFSEFNQLPITSTHKYNTINAPELSNLFIEQQTTYQNLHGGLNSQQCQQHIQNEKKEDGDIKCIISQGVNTKGHMTVYPENAQNSCYDNVEKVKTETSCTKKRKKYEEDPHEDEEEERRRLQAKKAKKYRDTKKEELKTKDDQIKQIQDKLQLSEREKMAYVVENKQLKEELKKKNVLLQLYEGN